MKKLLIALVLVITMTFTQACSPETVEQNMVEKEETATPTKVKESVKEKEILKIGTMANNIGAPIYYAYENGLYADAGLNVEVILFPTGAPINEALAAEQIDIAGSGLASVYALASGDCTWLGDIDVTLAGMGIYVRPDSPILADKGLVDGKPELYGSAESLKGITVLGPLGTASHYNAITWVQNFGLDDNDFEMLHMEFAPALQAFKAGEGDAVALNPPLTYEAEDLGYINVADLYVSSGVKLMNGVLGRTEIVEERREDVKTFMEITFGVVDKFYEDDKTVFDYSIDFYNRNGKEYTEEVMNKEIRDRDFYGLIEFTKPEYRFGSTMLGMGKFYVDNGKISKNLQMNIPDSMDPTFLEEIYGIDIKVFGE